MYTIVLSACFYWELINQDLDIFLCVLSVSIDPSDQDLATLKKIAVCPGPDVSFMCFMNNI